MSRGLATIHTSCPLVVAAVVEQYGCRTCRSIQHFADRFLDQNAKLDCIINNAGVFMPEHRKTPEGFEVCTDELDVIATCFVNRQTTCRSPLVPITSGRSF